MVSLRASVDPERLPLLGTPLNAPNIRNLGVTSAIFLMLNRMIGTGIFSTPSSIYEATGSVGMTLLFWVIGGVVMLCGFSIYFEYGLEMPESGGELNYLNRVFRRPKHLAVVVFAFSGLLLSSSASNSYTMGLYLQLALGIKEPGERVSRYIGLVVVIAVSIVHGVWPRAGRIAFNALGAIKVVILVSIALSGLLVLAGVLQVPGGRPSQNFVDMFHNDGLGGGLYNYAVALLRISYSYRGWETANMVMGEVRKPWRTMAIAGPLAIFSVVVLYLLCNIAYFAVVPKDEIVNSGAIIAGTFFMRLFGESAAGRVLPFFICLSNLGNVLVVTYACARVVQKFGEMHLLPASDMFASTRPFGTPLAGLAAHVVMTAVTLLLPPPGDVYNFVVDLSTYPVAYFSTAITLGLVYLHRNSERENWGGKRHSWHSPSIAIVVFLTANAAMLLFPWIPPRTALQTSIPYYASPLGAVLVLGLSAVYWRFWRTTEAHKRLEEFQSEPKQDE